MSTTAERYHDISCGHRVVGQGGKCEHLHGHNYRIHFTVIDADGGVDEVGRVLDFSAIKSHLCAWLEEHWDHKFLVFDSDPLRDALTMADPQGVVWVPFNPTAENMARYLVLEVGPQQLKGTGCLLIKVRIDETRKCSAAYELDAFTDNGF